MKKGFVLPFGGPRDAAELARAAEQAGWDGFFVWEAVWGVDAWVSLGAAAMLTSKIRLGTMLTPVGRMRPWKLASETATLDQLSGGRTILSVGLGALDSGYEAFGEVTDLKTRAELMDEGLEILTGLWKGQPYQFEGKHYQVKPTDFSPPPPPVQKPRIPIWMVGLWGSEKSMRRVVKYDGLLPNVRPVKGSIGGPTYADIRAMREWVDAQRPGLPPLDIIVEGEIPGDDKDRAAEIRRRWEEAGATWWIEAHWEAPREPENLRLIRERIEQGP